MSKRVDVPVWMAADLDGEGSMYPIAEAEANGPTVLLSISDVLIQDLMKIITKK